MSAATKPKTRDVRVKCAGCGVEIVGVQREDGKIYASRWPKADAPLIVGICMSCAEKEVLP